MFSLRFMTGALVGAGLVYLFDPQHGPQRRARLRSFWNQNQDQVLETINETGDAVRRAGRTAVERVQDRTTAGSTASS